MSHGLNNVKLLQLVKSASVVCHYEQNIGVFNVRSALSQACNEVLEFRLTRKKYGNVRLVHARLVSS